MVDNPSLADVQKLEYLMCSLKGSAAEAVKGFAVRRENYQPVLSHLNSEYVWSMRKFYDEVVGHIRSVESIGEKFRSETLAPVFVPLIVNKLPKRVVEKWELKIGDHKEDYVKVKHCLPS